VKAGKKQFFKGKKACEKGLLQGGKALEAAKA